MKVLAQLGGRTPAPRMATRGFLYAPESNELIDDGLILWFPAPASFTGENVVEYHVHGSPAIVRELMDRAVRMSKSPCGRTG